MEKQEFKDALTELYRNKKIRIGMGAAAVGVVTEFSSAVIGRSDGAVAGIVIGFAGLALTMLGANDIHKKHTSEL